MKKEKKETLDLTTPTTFAIARLYFFFRMSIHLFLYLVISMPLCLSERRSAYVGRFASEKNFIGEYFLYEDDVDDDDRICMYTFPHEIFTTS